MKGHAYAPMPNAAAIEEGMDGSVSDSLLSRLSSSPAPSSMPLSVSEMDFDDANDSSSDYENYADLVKVVNITSFTIYGFIIAIGLIGNLIVIFSILRTYRRISFTSMMLCSLAVADLLFTSVFVPIQLYSSYHANWRFGFVGCYLVSFLWFLSPASSAMMLLVISAERYIVIIHPLQAKVFLTKKMGLIIVNVTWLIAVVLSLVSIPFTTYQEKDYEGTVYKVCNRETTTPTSKILKISYFIGVLYALPLLGMFFCNIRVIITLYRSSRVTRSMQSVNLTKGGYNNGVNRSSTSGAYSAGRLSCGMESEISTVISHNGPTSGDATSISKSGGKRKNRMHSTLQERKRVMVLLGILVITYALLWGPLMILQIVHLHVEISHTVSILLSLAFHLLAMSNSAFNPVVYALMSRSFRKVIKTAFTTCCRRIPPPRLQWRSTRFTSTRDRGSSLSNSTQMTQYSMRSINNADSLKRSNGANPHGYIYLRNNNVH